MNSLKELKDIGAFVPDELVKKEIRFNLEEQGEEFTALIHVRRLSVGSYEQINVVAEPDRDSRLARLISCAVRLGEDGEEPISYVEAYQLHRRLAGAMLTAIAEVNGTERKN